MRQTAQSLQTLRAIILGSSLLVSSLPALAASTVAGVTYADSAQISGNALQLNGAGVRTRFFFDIYAIGLYLPEKQTNASEILASRTAKHLQLQLLRELSAKQFVEALVEAVEKNHPGDQLLPLQARLDTLKSLMLSLERAKKNDLISIDWLPESAGTQLSLNGKALGQLIPGADFYRALLSIWLGDKPAQEDLKAALLGHAR